MSFSEYIKTQVKHHRCVICGRTFGAQYDEIIKSFPVYHPYVGKNKKNDPNGKNIQNCEDVLYKELLRLYRSIHDSGGSRSVRSILDEFPWSNRIIMRKEMLEWCIRQGYFAINNLKRLEVPPAIEDTCKEIFSWENIEDPEVQENAIELLKAALLCFHGDLEIPLNQDIPIQTLAPHQDESKSAEDVNVPSLNSSEFRNDLKTSVCDRARGVDTRMHTVNLTMERRRHKD